MNWISVRDRLPDGVTTVLIYVPGDNEPVWLGYCEDGHWYMIEGRECRPSHWAKIPAPDHTA